LSVVIVAEAASAVAIRAVAAEFESIATVPVAAVAVAVAGGAPGREHSLQSYEQPPCSDWATGRYGIPEVVEVVGKASSGAKPIQTQGWPLSLVQKSILQRTVASVKYVEVPLEVNAAVDSIVAVAVAGDELGDDEAAAKGVLEGAVVVGIDEDFRCYQRLGLGAVAGRKDAVAAVASVEASDYL
jgi:hypothetical protein